MINDLKFAVRQLLKHPGFTAVAVLTLALGIGANAIVFSWIRGVLLAGVPGTKDPHELIVLCSRHSSGAIGHTLSLADIQDLAGEERVFAGVTGSSFDVAALRAGGEIEWVWTEAAMANFFDVLGVQPLLGRFFQAGEDQNPGGDTVAVLGEEFWTRRFQRDPGILGRTIEISGRQFVVVGIAPRAFQGGMGGLRFDAWIPVSMAPQFGFADRALIKRGNRFLHTYARLQPGVTRAQAQAAADTTMRRLESEYPDTNRSMGAALIPVWKAPWGGQALFLPLLRSLAVVSVLLLLLVAANIGNLLLARATARTREMAVRLSLGAKRGRLARQLMTENLLLAAGGGVAGCLVAFWGVQLLFKLMPATYLPVDYDLRLDGPVLLFTAGVTLASAVLFGLAPALRSMRGNLIEGLKHSARTGAAAGQTLRLRNGLVVAEMALALTLLAGMALAARSLHTAGQVDLGLQPRNVWVAGFRLPPTGYHDGRAQEVFRRLEQELAALPGVESAGLADWLPLGFEGGSSARFGVDGYQPTPGEPMGAGVSVVSPGYFSSLRISIVEGRGFTPRETPDSLRVAVINEHLARRYFGDRTPLGAKIRFWNQEFTIVGVAQAGKYQSLNEPPQPFIYVPEAQFGGLSMSAIVRTAGPPEAVGNVVERTALRVDPNLKPMAAMPMTQFTAAAFAIPKVAAVLLGFLGAMALLLAVLGLYGVLSCCVTQRTREIGIRMALGADRASVLRLFLRHGLALAGSGVLLGLIGTVAASRVLSSLLVGISALDPLSYLLAIAVLTVAALTGTWLPARRAALTQPMEALRHE